MSDLTKKLDTIDSYYGEINDLTKNNTYKYIQIDELQYSPIDVGSMCSDEHHLNTGYLDTIKYWDVEDTIDMCLFNAQKMYSNMKWEEENLIHSNSMVKQPGLSIIEKSSDGHSEKDVQFFKDSVPKGYVSDFNIETKANTSIDLFGYFVPDITGTWTFSLLNTDIAQLWITNDRALYDYTTKNANINSESVLNNNSKTFSIELKKDEYYPIRVQIGNLTLQSNTSPILSVISPTQDLISKNSSNHNYFVSLLYNGQPYMKKLLYFGLVQSDQKRKENKKLFQCVFVNQNTQNYDTIKKLKVNESRIFRTSEIPTTITYQSVKYNVSTDDHSPINIDTPPGSNLQILNSRYGLTNDRIENKPVSLTIPETDPTKTIKQDYTTFTYKQGTNNNYRDASAQLLSSSFVDPKPVKTIYQDNWVSIPSSKDTTRINQSMINRNQLNIGGDYNSIYGDPAPGYEGKSVSIDYKYSQTFNSNDTTNNITNKTLYLDSSGQLVIGYDFNGTTNSSVISILNNADKCNDICNYVLKLKDDGNLAIYNNQKIEIWKMKLANLPHLSKILPNKTWYQNPNRRSILNRGEKLSPSSVPDLISDNGKFKLRFEHGKLVVKYSSISYNEVKHNNSVIRYTDTSISHKGKQIYYLYRVKSSGLNGKQFLSKTSKTGNNNDNTLWHLQNNSDQILKFNSYGYNKNIEMFPLLTNAEYNSIINTTTPYNIGDKYSVVNVPEVDCKTSCQNNVNCNHFFYMNTSTGGKCMQDTASNSNPMFSYINPTEKIKSSYLGNKRYNVYTSCGNNEQSQPIRHDINRRYSYYNIAYNNISVNDSKNTYYCAEDIYINNNKKILDIYTNKSGFTTMEGMTLREGIDSNESNILMPTLDRLTTNAGTLQLKQSDVSNNYIATMNAFNKHKSLTQTLDTDFYRNNDIDKTLFGKFEIDDRDSKPDIGIEDAIKKDTNIMILQQNTLYTIGTITAATLLIFAIVLARD
jgi:hypothetical protein